MRPANGTYRLTDSSGLKPMDVVVDNSGAHFLLDDLAWNQGADQFVAARLSLTIECTGSGTGTAWVGSGTGTVVPFTCQKIA